MKKIITIAFFLSQYALFATDDQAIVMQQNEAVVNEKFINDQEHEYFFDAIIRSVLEQGDISPHHITKEEFNLVLHENFEAQKSFLRSAKWLAGSLAAISLLITGYSVRVFLKKILDD